MSQKLIRFLDILITLQNRVLEEKDLDLNQLEELAKNGKVGRYLNLPGCEQLFKVLEEKTIAGNKITVLQITHPIVIGKDLALVLEKEYHLFPNNLPDEKITLLESYIKNHLLQKALIQAEGKGTKRKKPKVFIQCYDKELNITFLLYDIPPEYKKGGKEGLCIFRKSWKSRDSIPYSFTKENIILVLEKK